MDIDVVGFLAVAGLNIFNQNWPEGIVGLVEIFALCCLVGGLVTFVLCRTRPSFIIRKTQNLKVINSTRLAGDRSKDAQ